MKVVPLRLPPGAEWAGERLLILTEDADTQDWLERRVRELIAGLHPAGQGRLGSRGTATPLFQHLQGDGAGGGGEGWGEEGDDAIAFRPAAAAPAAGP